MAGAGRDGMTASSAQYQQCAQRVTYTTRGLSSQKRTFLKCICSISFIHIISLSSQTKLLLLYLSFLAFFSSHPPHLPNSHTFSLNLCGCHFVTFCYFCAGVIHFPEYIFLNICMLSNISAKVTHLYFNCHPFFFFFYFLRNKSSAQMVLFFLCVWLVHFLPS